MTTTTQMSDDGYAALQAAVFIARDHQIRSRSHLEKILGEHGYTAGDIDEALTAWSGYLQAKPVEQVRDLMRERTQ